ncbi:MAG TPA: aspartate dehydrogenase [bacterium]
MNRIGVVGCGTLGQTVVRAVAEGRLQATLAGVTSRSESKAAAFLASLPSPPPYLDLDRLIAESDLLVETAGPGAVPQLAERTFRAGKALMVISIGALLDRPDLIQLARDRNCRLILPSGAIAGLDGIKAACRGTVESVLITTRKPPQGLAGAPYLRETRLSLEGITQETEVFHGPVREACRGFPDNVNVAAAVSLAGIGPDRTRIRILAVPGLERNCHTVEIRGEFGAFTMRIENVPTENPKTGRLTAMSILQAIHDAMDPVRIG